MTSSDTGLSDEQRDFVAAIRDFSARECTPEKRAALDGDRNHSEAIAKQLAGLGWYGLQIEEEYGGSGGTFLDAALFLEETAARPDPSRRATA